jgi:hypothetical protein
MIIMTTPSQEGNRTAQALFYRFSTTKHVITNKIVVKITLKKCPYKLKSAK